MATVTREHLAGLLLAKANLNQVNAEVIDALIAQASAAPEQEAVEIDWPEFNEQGMGCGLEDRGITDRYEAMRYGYEEALDQVAQVIEGIGPPYTHAARSSGVPVPVPDTSHFKSQVLELISDECKYWQGRDEARRGGFAILYAKVNELSTAKPADGTA